MLEKLTPKQEKIMKETRDEWITHYLHSGYETNYETLRPLIDWVYKKAGLPKTPLILIADGYITQKLMINHLIGLLSTVASDQVENQVWSQAGDQVWSQVDDQVENQVGSQVKNQVVNQVWGQVGNQVRDQVWSQVEDQVKNQVEDQVKNQVGNQSTPAIKFYEHYFGAWNSGWLSFYDMFEKIGIVKNSDFDKYKELQRQAFSIVMFDSFVVVCKLPKKVHTSIHGLHSTNGPCIEWRDGINTSYFIHGVNFGDEKNLFDDGGGLYKNVVERKLEPEQLLKIENTDQRFVAINHYGFENMIDKMNPVVLDTGKYGNQLMSVVFDNMDIRILTYPDIDGNGARVSFVDPTLDTADDAMAWKHNCTVDEYYRMEVLQSWNI